jgi:hypothetical protein
LRRWFGSKLGGWSGLVPNKQLEPTPRNEERPRAAAQL